MPAARVIVDALAKADENETTFAKRWRALESRETEGLFAKLLNVYEISDSLRRMIRN